MLNSLPVPLEVTSVVYGLILFNFRGTADEMPKNELVTFQNLRPPHKKMLLLTATASLLWIAVPVAGSHWTKKWIYLCLQTEQMYCKFGAPNLN